MDNIWRTDKNYTNIYYISFATIISPLNMFTQIYKRDI